MKPPAIFSKMKAKMPYRYTFLAAVIILFLSVMAISAFTKPIAYAEADYNFSDLPEAVADTLGIDEFSAGILVSAVVLTFITAIVGFTLMKAEGNTALYGIIICDFVGMGFLVGLGFLPYWIFLIVCLLVAVLFANTLRSLITGGGE